MSAALAEPPRKIWTRSEVDILTASGHFNGTRFELIEGEVFDKMGQNPPHASTVCRLVAALAAIFGLDRIRTQMPVEPAPEDRTHSLPEPDVVVTREPEAAWRTRHPGAEDVLLIAEVADSTYDYDVRRKAKLYARAGFSEYIVLDITGQELLVFQSPRAGTYTEIHVRRPGDSFVPLNAASGSISVSTLPGS